MGKSMGGRFGGTDTMGKDTGLVIGPAGGDYRLYLGVLARVLF